MRSKILKVSLTLFIVLFLIGSNTQAGTILPGHGTDGSLLVKCGNSHPDNHSHFRWSNPGIKDSLIYFDAEGNTSFLPFTYYSVREHQHVVKDITDMDSYKIPSAIGSDNSFNAAKAAFTETVTHAKNTDKADHAAHTKEGTHSKAADFSQDAYPATSGENETMVYNAAGNKWINAPMLTAKTVPDGIWEYTMEGKAYWNSLSAFLKQYVEFISLTNTLFLISSIGGAILLLITLIILLVTFAMSRKQASWQKGVGAIFILFALLSILFPHTGYCDFPSQEGEDGYLLVKEGGPDKQNDYKWQWLNNPKDDGRKNVLIGFDDKGKTDFSSLTSYSRNPHTHLYTIVMDLATYKIPSAAQADNCTDCTAAKDSDDATRAMHSDEASDSAKCEEVIHSKVSKQCGNGLPLGLEDNATMTYFTDRKWVAMPHQFPANFKRNSLLGTDSNGKYVMIAVSDITKDMQSQSAAIKALMWVVPILFALCIIALVLMFIFMGNERKGWRIWWPIEVFWVDKNEKSQITVSDKSADFILLQGTGE